MQLLTCTAHQHDSNCSPLSSNFDQKFCTHLVKNHLLESFTGCNMTKLTNTLIFSYPGLPLSLCILCEKRRSCRDCIVRTVIVNSILKASIRFYYVKELPPTNSCQRKCLQMRKLNKAEIPRNNAPNSTQQGASNKFSRV